MKRYFILISLFLLIGFISPQGLEVPSVYKTNYSAVGVNDSLYWDGNAWIDDRWLETDGSNAMSGNLNVGGNYINNGKFNKYINISSTEAYPYGKLLFPYENYISVGIRGYTGEQTMLFHVEQPFLTSSEFRIISSNTEQDGFEIYNSEAVGRDFFGRTDGDYNLGRINKRWKNLFISDLINGTDANLLIKNITLNGTSISDWSEVNISSSGGSSLWENISNVATYNNSVRINDGAFSLGTTSKKSLSSSMFTLNGNYNVDLPLAMMNFAPTLSGNQPFFGVYFNPIINTSQKFTAFPIQPTYSQSRNTDLLIFNINTGSHLANSNQTSQILNDVLPRTITHFSPFLNDSGKIINKGIVLGNSITYQDFSGGAYGISDNLITLKGGVSSYTNVGTGVVTQRGLKFEGFGTVAGGDVKALESNGGIFDFLGGSYVNISNAEINDLTITGNTNIAGGYSGYCVNTTFTNGIATGCND